MKSGLAAKRRIGCEGRCLREAPGKTMSGSFASDAEFVDQTFFGRGVAGMAIAVFAGVGCRVNRPGP